MSKAWLNLLPPRLLSSRLSFGSYLRGISVTKSRSGALLVYSLSSRANPLFSLAAFLLISVTAGGLSPLMAYVFSQLDGRQGIPGWQWIFVSTIIQRSVSP